MSVSISAINTAIAETVGTATGIVRVQDVPDLTEGAHDLPLVQVYWQSSVTDDEGSTDRLTFGAGVRLTRLTYHADVYARQRSHLGEDVAKTLALAEAVQTVLERERGGAFFGLAGVKALRWSAERITIENGGTQYMGARFIIDVWVF
ncbi:MAG: hypothetical protein SGJ24_04450 [Chloroflexota bacterium]|nr:hypothetical protein [Chloroflexota bacterium]